MAGRPNARRAIVEQQIILNPDIQFTLSILIPLLDTNDRCIEWLARHHLIRNESICRCNQPATLNRYYLYIYVINCY